ncbi:MAG TPA: DNA-3-methyladenine glycosylase [Planctomycetota bacterium]|nr:DNA-3-methyladenine glycosylase [Planctomycetota bacterium]
MRRVEREFYDRPALEVAPELLGKLLLRRIGRKVLAGRIVEAEAYMGLDDQASHARRGPTPRAKIMFGPPGFAYVYMIYGMHHGMNVVCDREGVASAVLLRALEPVRGIEGATDGPGKLCRALSIDRALNGEDLVVGKKIWIEDDGVTLPHVTTERVGVSYAGEWARKPWRFCAQGCPHVSRPRPPPTT